jgi:diguanylate cyclase (GGDEF)-like protein
MTLDPLIATIALGLAIALIGALAGTAGFSALVVRRQNRRVAALAEHLTQAQDEGELIALDANRIRDPRLRNAFAALADRVADTWRLATVDPLTLVANRQAILGRVDEEIARAARYRRPLSVILLDLDHFKRLNDSHGHAAGDLVLRQVGLMLAENVRATDVAGRYGGEEFLILLPDTPLDGAVVLAEKLRQELMLVEVPGVDRSVSASFGVAVYPTDAPDGEMLVRMADRALYAAKSRGRNCVVTSAELVVPDSSETS